MSIKPFARQGNRMSKDHKIRVAINRKVKGKYSGDNWGWYNRQFKVEDTTAHGLAADIYRGYAFTPVYKNGWRKKENFDLSWHIAFDFDTQDHRSSIETIHQDIFFASYGSFAYSTPSSRHDAPKSRAVFIFEEPITDRQLYEDLYRALLQTRYSVCPLADQATKDAARLFFGSEKCILSPVWEILDMETVNGMVSMWREMERDRKAKEAAANPKMVIEPSSAEPIFERTLQTMYQTLTTAQNGMKHDTLRRCAYALGGYISGGYISEPDAINFLVNAIGNMSDVENSSTAQKTARDCLTSGQSKPLYIEQSLAPSIGSML